jgi:hypothetical protein
MKEQWTILSEFEDCIYRFEYEDINSFKKGLQTHKHNGELPTNITYWKTTIKNK